MIIDKKILKLLIDTTDKRDFRKEMQNILFEKISDTEFNLVASDGRSLFVINQKDIEHKFDKSFMIDKSILKILIKHKNWTFDRSTYYLKLSILKDLSLEQDVGIAEKFPNYHQVIPKNNNVLLFEFTNDVPHIKFYKDMMVSYEYFSKLAALKIPLKFYSQSYEGHSALITETQDEQRSQKTKFIFMPMRKI